MNDETRATDTPVTKKKSSTYDNNHVKKACSTNDNHVMKACVMDDILEKITCFTNETLLGKKHASRTTTSKGTTMVTT